MLVLTSERGCFRCFTKRKMCSLSVQVLVIIVANIICSVESAIDPTKQLNYYQSLQRHLNDFTVKDDADDLLALPSDDTPAVAVAVPPPDFDMNAPVTQYAPSVVEEEQKEKKMGFRPKKPRNRRRKKQEDNAAQESVQSVAVAAPPERISPSTQIIEKRSDVGDTLAQESYQSGTYAEPPAEGNATTVSPVISERRFDQYIRSGITGGKGQKSSNTGSGYPEYHGSTGAHSKGRESYAPEAYQDGYDQYRLSEVPPPPPPPTLDTSGYYEQRHVSGHKRTKDSHALESYHAPMAYAPPPTSVPASQLTPSVESRGSASDNHAQETYHAPSAYAPPPPPSTTNYYPSYHTSESRYPSHSSHPQQGSSGQYPPPPPPPPSHRYYSPPPPPPPPVTAYHPPYSPSSYLSPESSSSNHHHYHAHPPPPPPPPPYKQSEGQPSYVAYPATTPAPETRAQLYVHRHHSYDSHSKPTVLHPASGSRTPSKNVVASASASSPLLAHHPHLTSIDKHQQEQRQQAGYASPQSSPSGIYEPFDFSPAPPGPPAVQSHPTSIPTQDVQSSPKDQSHAEDSLYKQQKLLQNSIGSANDVYRLATTAPTQLITQAIKFLSGLSIPKDHYLNVVSFVGIYLFLAIVLYGQEDRSQPKCEGGEEHLLKEWHYHVGRRFVPAVNRVDPKLQKKFLKLFKGIHLDEYDDDDGGSSEEHPSMINAVNEMCPRTAFFSSMAPMHLEARMQVQRILVAQPTPLHVYAAAKALLFKHRIHPKVWYLGLVGAALERPDMTGFKLIHPVDAIPDWFIPGHLIQDEMDRYRSVSMSRSLKKRVRRAAGNATTTVATTTPTTTTSLEPSSSSTTTTAPSNQTTTSKLKFTRKPLIFTRRTTTFRPPDFAYFMSDSGSVENFVLDGTPPHMKGDKFSDHDYIPFDDETINSSAQKYQSINTIKGSKYKPKKKVKRPSSTAPPKDDNLSQPDQSNSESIEADADTSNAIDTSASVEAETENTSASGGVSSAAGSGQLSEISAINTLAPPQNEVPAIIETPVSARPSHLQSPHHNAIKVGDLTVVVGEGPTSLLDDIPIYSLEAGHYGKNKHEKGKGKGSKKGHKKGKGKGKDDDDEKCIVVDGKVGRDNGIENKLWYFREDIMVNQMHWYWHTMHPMNATRHPDRRAELFFFTHRQFLARYYAERISNGLPKMLGTNKLGPGGIMIEPYHSHLVDVASGRYWTPRFPKRLMRDIRHEHNPDIGMNVLLRDTQTTYDRLVRSVQAGLMISRKQGLLPIRNTMGIEPLANTVEATELSVNPAIYNAFGLHNMGHLVIGLVEDPDWRYKKTPGVMADTATSMRDPVFYNYHAFIDNIMEKYKETLSPYKVTGGEFPLLWKGVNILDMEMISKNNEHHNQLRTFWTKKKFELAPSVDGSTRKEEEHAKICAVHLAHEPFTFKFVIERQPCAKSKSGKGTIRIFIAPRFDEKGRRFHIREQRRLMIQLDAFQAKLRVGKNIITRRSHDSSLTQPWTKHMRDFKEEHPSGAADFCGCGWPQHLYIPKGNHKGLPFDLFVMVTNYDEDYVPNHPKDLEIPETCNSPYLFCGHPRRRYPDARPMGYPWDRPPYKTPIPCLPGHSFAAVVCKSFNLVAFKPIDYLEEFVAKAPNMKSIVFDIKHIDKLVKGYHHERRHKH